MTPAIQTLIDPGGVPDESSVDAFLSQHTFPIVEGGSVTFLYRGAADRVQLRHFIFGLPTAQPFQRLDGTEVWYLVMDLPRCSRIEYKIELVRGEKREWIMDPLNPRVAHDPYGANSVC